MILLVDTNQTLSNVTKWRWRKETLRSVRRNSRFFGDCIPHVHLLGSTSSKPRTEKRWKRPLRMSRTTDDREIPHGRDSASFRCVSPDISVRATSRRRQPLRRRRYVARGVAEATEATGRRKRRRKLKQPSAASKRRGADRETGPKLQAHELSSGVSSRDLHHMILFVEVAPCLKRKRVVPFKDHIPRLWNVSQSVSQKWCNNSTVTGPSVEEFHTRRNSSEAKAIGFRSDRKCESTSESLSDIL